MKCILRSRLRQTSDPPRLPPPRATRRVARWIVLVAVALAVASGLRAVLRAREDRLHLATGGARWIWWTYDLEQPSPLHFYAAKSFALAAAPVSAGARIFVDGRWELFVNGRSIAAGEQGPGDHLTGFDLTGMLRPGPNTISIEVKHRTGAGGILFALDLADRKNAIVSDSTWQVGQSEQDPRAGRGRPAVVWGKPPMHPWGYP